jgi:hypothetical protein
MAGSFVKAPEVIYLNEYKSPQSHTNLKANFEVIVDESQEDSLLMLFKSITEANYLGNEFLGHPEPTCQKYT